MMSWHSLVIFAPLVAMLMVAAGEDLRSRRIPNWLTAIIALTGLIQSFSAHGTVTPVESIIGLLAGGALNLAFYLIHARGGGDVKLLAGAGAWLGAALVLKVFLASAVVGMVLVLVQCALQGKLLQLLRNTGKVLVGLVHIRSLGVANLVATAASCRTVRRPLPHAVPLLVATLLMLVRGGGVL